MADEKIRRAGVRAGALMTMATLVTAVAAAFAPTAEASDTAFTLKFKEGQAHITVSAGSKPLTGCSLTLDGVALADSFSVNPSERREFKAAVGAGKHAADLECAEYKKSVEVCWQKGPTPRPIPTGTPSPTVKPTPTVTPTPTVKPTPTVTPTPTVKPTPTVTPTPTGTPTPIVDPTATAAPTGTPTPIVDPTATAAPTVAPTPIVDPTVDPKADPKTATQIARGPAPRLDVSDITDSSLLAVGGVASVGAAGISMVIGRLRRK